MGARTDLTVPTNLTTLVIALEHRGREGYGSDSMIPGSEIKQKEKSIINPRSAEEREQVRCHRSHRHFHTTDIHKVVVKCFAIHRTAGHQDIGKWSVLVDTSTVVGSFNGDLTMSAYLNDRFELIRSVRYHDVCTLLRGSVR